MAGLAVYVAQGAGESDGGFLGGMRVNGTG